MGSKIHPRKRNESQVLPEILHLFRRGWSQLLDYGSTTRGNDNHKPSKDMKKGYYSALDKTDTSLQYPAVKMFEYNGSIAFHADIDLGLPEPYRSADLLYIEPPWKDGFEKVNERAGVEKPSYPVFLNKINHIIESETRPVIVINGVSSKKYMFPTQHIVPVKLNGYLARAFLYNIKPNGLDFTDCPSLLKSLAKQFNCVGDFCCGYGTTGKVFAESGKKFIMSDINPRCIGYIKQEAPNWYENIQK